MTTCSDIVRPVITLLGAAALGGAATWALRRRREVAHVAPDLREGIWHTLDLVPVPVMSVFARLAGDKVPATRLADGVTAEPREVTGPDGTPVRVRLYEPGGRTHPSPALLWIHGGGHILGAAQMDDDLCSDLARDLGILVVGVDYRLSPAHPFPADFDDCWAALTWLRAAAPELGVDADRIAIGGASAGGGLAAAVAQKAVDEGVPLVFQLLEYPMLDDRTSLVADHQGRGRFQWTPAANRAAWQAYLGRPTTPTSTMPEYAVPARRNDLAGLPPTWIIVGSIDLFLAESQAYAERLRGAGVPTELHVVDGLYHGADGGRTAGTGHEVRVRMGRALAAGLGLQSPQPA